MRQPILLAQGAELVPYLLGTLVSSVDDKVGAVFERARQLFLVNVNADHRPSPKRLGHLDHVRADAPRRPDDDHLVALLQIGAGGRLVRGGDGVCHDRQPL